MVVLIQSNQVFSVNNEQYTSPNNPQGLSIGELIPSNSEPLGFYWVLPNVIGGRVKGCLYQSATSATKPRSDAAKVQRLRIPDGRIMEIYVTDVDGTSSNTVPSPTGGSTFAYYANGLGGSTPVMTAVTVPLPIAQFAPAITSPGATKDNTFYFTFPANPNTLDFNIDGIWLNGLVPAATQPVDKTTTALYATWANSNMTGYGTWAAVNATTLSLVSNTGNTVYVKQAGIEVSLIAVPYCFDLTSFSAGQAIDGLKLGSSATLALTPFIMTDDPAILMVELQQSGYFGNSVFTHAIAHKLQIVNIQAVPHLYLATVLKSTAAAAVCS